MQEQEELETVQEPAKEDGPTTAFFRKLFTEGVVSKNQQRICFLF